MKPIILILLLILSLTAFSQRSYVVRPNAQGYLNIDNRNGFYKPGDSILLEGHFKAAAVSNLSGAKGKNIYISNVRGKTVVIGDSTWNGGSWGQGIIFSNCHYIKFAGSAKGKLKIIGSKISPARTAYMDLGIVGMSDNFIVHTLTIKYGGVGIVCKSEVWRSDITLNNFDFFSIDFYGTYNEAAYIGHTSSYWNIITNQPYYPGPNDKVDTTIYKRAIRLNNVKFYKNKMDSIGNDGAQFAAINNLKVYNNVITGWGKKQEWAHSGGIVIGGRITGFSVYDNYVHHGFGDMLQIFADAGPATVKNNLLVSNKGEGIQIRTGKGLVVTFTNNTVAYTGVNNVRINGYYGGTGKHIFRKNLLLKPTFSGPYYPKYTFYLENGGQVDNYDNKIYPVISDAMVNEANYFQPLPGSPSTGYGYIKKS